MTLNQREQKIAWTVGIVVALAAVYYIVFGLFFPKMSDYDKRIADAKVRLDGENKQINSQKETNAKWTALGIEREKAVVDIQVFTTLNSIAGRTGIPASSITTYGTITQIPKPVQRTDYSEVSYKIGLSSNAAMLSKLIYALETSGAPIKLASLSINTPRQGEDMLQSDLTLVALMYTPKTNGPTRTSTTARSTAAAASVVKPEQAPPSESTIEQMMKRREQQLKESTGSTTSPASAGAATTAPSLTLEEIEAEMAKKRSQQLEQSATMPGIEPAPAPATAPGGVR